GVRRDRPYRRIQEMGRWGETGVREAWPPRGVPLRREQGPLLGHEPHLAGIGTGSWLRRGDPAERTRRSGRMHLSQHLRGQREPGVDAADRLGLPPGDYATGGAGGNRLVRNPDRGEAADPGGAGVVRRGFHHLDHAQSAAGTTDRGQKGGAFRGGAQGVAGGLLGVRSAVYRGAQGSSGRNKEGRPGGPPHKKWFQVIGFPALPTAGIHGIEHRNWKRRALSLLTPQPPVSPTAGSMP